VSWARLILLLCAACVCSPARAQLEVSLSEAQVASTLTRAEQLLAAGQPERAYNALAPVVAALLSTRGETYRGYSQLLARMTMVSSTAVVRTRGRVSWQGAPPADPAASLREAEARMLEVLQPRQIGIADATTAKRAPPATWVARHGEALAALGRHPEAYAVLQPLFASRALTEPEALAALALSAQATGHPESVEPAHARCRKLAKSRAAQICGGKQESEK
jgi:hypothetical protein